ncbi:MAG: L-2-amino-thiazoline-4-carboxylic acid hydrolase [Boseongicola sp.]|nr:L-2-amino-thiazoline-4-carboxylic acid hydrolase [Boseongicola sp.]NNJ68438.1 hypothetical protein [Boseongicola sp.]
MRRLIGWVWQRAFLGRLTRQTGFQLSATDVQAEINRMPRGQMPGTDAARRFNLLMAESLHAAARLLEREAGLPREDAVEAARTAFVSGGSWLARGFVRLWLRLERDPYKGVDTRGAAPLSKALWGNGMVVEDRRGHAHISLCVLSCPFQDYFWNVGRSDLTPVLCEWDTNWQTEVNASPRPIRVDIKSTLARGDDLCEFTFTRACETQSRQ